MTAAVSRLAEPAADAAIAAATKTLQLPTIRAQASQLAAAAAKQRLSHKAFLAEVSAYDLTCRLWYDLTCRSRQGDHGMVSPPVTRVRRSLRR